MHRLPVHRQTALPFTAADDLTLLQMARLQRCKNSHGTIITDACVPACVIRAENAKTGTTPRSRALVEPAVCEHLNPRRRDELGAHAVGAPSTRTPEDR